MSAVATDAGSPHDAPLQADFVVAWLGATAALRARARDVAARSGGDADAAPASAVREPRDIAAALVESLGEEPRFAWLCSTFELDVVDAAIVLIVAAPDLDEEFGAIYARLQHDPALTRAGGALCLRMLSDDAGARLRLHQRFAAARPLVRQRVLLALDAGTRAADPWRSGQLIVDPQVLRTLLYDDALDARIATYGRLVSCSDATGPVAMSTAAWDGVVAQMRRAKRAQAPAKFLFRGAPGSGRAHAAQALARVASLRVLAVDLAYLRSNAEFAELVAPLFREAWLRDALLYVEGLDVLLDAGMGFEVEQFLENVQDDGGMIALAVRAGWLPPAGRATALDVVDFGEVDVARRRLLWRQALAARGHRASRAVLDLLAERFRLNPGQIEAAVAQAQRGGMSRGERNESGLVGSRDLLQAARGQSPHELVPLARKVEPVATWSDLVLPADAVTQLHELCARLQHRVRVLERWGFGAKLNLGKGTSALFAGPSGTGKTMAAEVVAKALDLDLYKIDLAAIVSKYIGETEKNLDRVFSAARNANAILLFDEADAIFGKRSEVRDSHDRYANLEISYLLQKMEEYDGLAILSTNLKQNLDEAFLRRLTYTVLFPFPDAADRERIWRCIWPADVPLDTSVDFAALAARCKLSGGNIKNVALAAAYLAAADGSAVRMRHVVHAIRRELQKAGKAVAESEFADLLGVGDSGLAAAAHA